MLECLPGIETCEQIRQVLLEQNIFLVDGERPLGILDRLLHFSPLLVKNRQVNKTF